MTYAPTEITKAAKVWTSNGGKNLGIVGNAAHRARQSYHNGKDAIDEYHRTAANDYSIRLKRDRNGLTNAASALDLGRLNGSLDELRAFSKWLVEYTQEQGPGTEDIREIIYAGAHKGKVVVLRWLRDRGVTSAPQPGEADDTHLTHSHISWYRDAEERDKTGPFRTYFGEDIVDVYSVAGLTSAEFAAGSPVYRAPTGPAYSKLGTTRRLDICGQDKPTSPTRYLCDGAGDLPSARMAWLDVSAATAKRDESYNAGVAAASAAAAKARR